MTAAIDHERLAVDIKQWGRKLGFAQLGIASVELDEDETRLINWLGRRRHGEMVYMERHGTKRSRPPELVPGTVRVISARMDYWPAQSTDPLTLLEDPTRAYISRYALGRDYHKVLRSRLRILAGKIKTRVGSFGYRAFVDSAPVLEKALARNAGLGWIGKHTNLLSRDAGSWFFLGELYTDLPLPLDKPTAEHCGTCEACIDACPTGAIVAPYQLDARLCISYLTIELRGSIPVELRQKMGNRVFGCDDCQLVCPWNRFSRSTTEKDFVPRSGIDGPELIELFQWSPEEFDHRTRGSAIRRVGYEGWLRNIAVALGNAPTSGKIVAALRAREYHPSALVREHVVWAIAQHEET